MQEGLGNDFCQFQDTNLWVQSIILKLSAPVLEMSREISTEISSLDREIR